MKQKLLSLVQKLWPTKISQTSSDLDQLGSLKIDFVELEKLVFKEERESIAIGGLEITPQLRSLLRDQAKNFESTQLFEIISATVTNEGVNLLSKSGNLEHLQYAKALLYWNTVVKKMIKTLAK